MAKHEKITGLMIVTTSAAILQGLVPVVELWTLGQLVDVLAGLASRRDESSTVMLRDLGPWVLLMIGVRLAHRLLAHIDAYAGNQLQENIVYRLQSNILAKASRVSLHEFETAPLQNKLSAIKNGMGLGFINVYSTVFMQLRTLLLLGGMVVVAGQGHWLIPVIVAAAGVPAVMLQNKHNVERYAMLVGNTPQKRMMNYIASLLTEQHCAKEIRLFQLGTYLTTRWQAIFEETRQRVFRQATRQRLWMALLQLLPMSACGASLLLLLRAVHSGQATLGIAVAVVSAVVSLQTNIELCVRNFGMLHNMYLRFVKVIPAFLNIPEPSPDKSAVSAEGEPSVLTVRNVSFSYWKGATPVLRQVTFQLKRGQSVAVLGENGAGKSTLAKLLLGLYEPGEGTIEGAATLWKKRTSAVFQDYARFHLTIRDNIGFGDVEHRNDLQRLERAAVHGGAASFVERLEDGYETMVGSTFGGRDLSGGQWQKLAIARAFMAEPVLIVLDEPTASLDPRAELEVYTRFREAAGNRTALLISHRIGFARLADTILFLKEGELVESGTHEELLKLNGEYAQLWRIQSRWYR